MLKQKVRALWELCFDDSPEFVDLYFDLRYRDQINMAKISDEGEVISAFQMIPYPMTCFNKTINTSYLSGACTHPKYRGKGIMKELFLKSFEQMRQNNILLSTLIPANPQLFEYYARVGYAPIFQYTVEKITNHHCSQKDNSIIIKKIDDCQQEVYAYLQQKLLQRPCCIQHTSTDFKVIMADLSISKGALYVAFRKERIMGLAIAYQEEEGVNIAECFAETEEVKTKLLFDIIEKSVHQDTYLTVPSCPNREKPLGMGRIIHAQALLQLYAEFYPTLKTNLAITDLQLSDNNGFFHVENGNCTFSTNRQPVQYHQLSISELCNYIFTPLQPYMSLMLN